MGAVLGDWSSGGGRRLVQAVDLLDDQKNRKCDNQKIEDIVEKDAVIQRGRAGRFRSRDARIILRRKIDKQVGKIDLAQSQAYGRHENIFDEGRDDSLTAAEFDELVTEYNLVSWTAHPALLRKAIGTPGMA